MRASVPVKNFTVPDLRLQVDLGNGILNNLIDFITSDVEKFSNAEEVARNTMATLNQAIAKRGQNCQIWDFNDYVMLGRKSMQLKQIQAMKDSTSGLIGIF